MTTTDDTRRRYDPATDGRLLRTKEVANMTTVGEKSVQRWSLKGAGPKKIKLASIQTPGGHRRYPEAWVREFLEQTGADGLAR